MTPPSGAEMDMVGAGEPKSRLPLIEVCHLRYVVAVVDHGSFRKAATRLGVRQSSVSRRIRDLEWLLGSALFIRHAAGVRPTEAGQCFARQAREILEALEAAAGNVGPGRAACDRDDRVDVPCRWATIESACLNCQQAEHQPDTSKNVCGLFGWTGAAGIRDATCGNAARRALRRDQATALGETILRLVDMLSSDGASGDEPWHS